MQADVDVADGEKNMPRDTCLITLFETNFRHRIIIIIIKNGKYGSKQSRLKCALLLLDCHDPGAGCFSSSKSSLQQCVRSFYFLLLALFRENAFYASPSYFPGRLCVSIYFIRCSFFFIRTSVVSIPHLASHSKSIRIHKSSLLTVRHFIQFIAFKFLTRV